MSHVLLVNNERDADDMGWIPYLRRALERAQPGIEVTVIHHSQLNEETVQKIAPTHTVLYGRVTHHWSMEEILSSYSSELEYLRHVTAPTLGICAGHQLLGIANGSGMDKMIPCDDIDIVESGFIRIFEDNKCPLFQGLESPFFCNCMHRDEIKRIPEGFERVAYGDVCQIHGIQKKGYPVFGLQFHPEWANEQFGAGQTILKNFLNL